MFYAYSFSYFQIKINETKFKLYFIYLQEWIIPTIIKNCVLELFISYINFNYINILNVWKTYFRLHFVPNFTLYMSSTSSLTCPMNFYSDVLPIYSTVTNISYLKTSLWTYAIMYHCTMLLCTIALCFE